MNTLTRAALLAIAVIAPATLRAETTNTQLLESVFYDAEADFAYFKAPAAWGAPSCPNATYVQVRSTVAGRKQLLSMGLTAQASGKTVRFQGTCANQSYFDATYIEVK